LISDVVVNVVRPLHVLKLEHDALMTTKFNLPKTKNSLQHLLQNKLNAEYVTCNQLKDILNTYIYGFGENTNKLENHLATYRQHGVDRSTSVSLENNGLKLLLNRRCHSTKV